MVMRWLAFLVVSALFAGCAAPEDPSDDPDPSNDEAPEPFRLPLLSVAITDGEGNPTHRIMADGEQKFVFHPSLVSGNLSHADAFGLTWWDQPYGFTFPYPTMLEDGELRTAEMVAGSIEDDRCTSPGQTGFSRQTGINGESPGSHTVYQRVLNTIHGADEVRPIARIAIDETFPPCTFDFSSAFIPTTERSCDNGRNAMEGRDFYWLYLSPIPLRDAADMQPWGESLADPDLWVRIVFDLDGDAELKLCRENGHEEPFTELEATFHEREDGKLEARLPESVLYSRHGPSILVNVFNNLPNQEVTLAATVHYPSTDPTP